MSSSSTTKTPAQIQTHRVQTNCKIIWGAGDDYEIDFENEDFQWYYCSVRKDFGNTFGPPLTMTGMCFSDDQAFNELDRMTIAMARIKLSGKPMTREETLDIFGGKDGNMRRLLERFMEVDERRKGEGRGRAEKSG